MKEIAMPFLMTDQAADLFRQQFETPAKRKAKLEKLLQNPKLKKVKLTLAGIPSSLVLFHVDNIYAAAKFFEGEEPQLVYWVTYVVRSIFGKKVVTQQKVWADTSTYGVPGLAKHIFYNKLLKNHDAVMTDSQQTRDGQRFWFSRVHEAIRDNKFVYYWNKKANSLAQLDNNYGKLFKEEQVWSDVSSLAEEKLIIISKTPIEVTK